MAGPDGHRPAIDLVRDGVDSRTLDAEGDRAVWGALLSTAESWHLRGSTFIDWAGTLDEPQSNLGRQAKIVSKTQRPRTRAGYERLLRKVWTKAEHYLATGPPLRTADDFRADAKMLGETLDLAPDVDELTGADRRMLRYVLTLAEQHGTRSPCVPCRPAADALGITPMTASRTLRRLVEAGWLDLAEQGVPRGPSAVGPPRASRYAVPVERLAARLPTGSVLLTGAGNSVSNTSHIVSNSGAVRESLTLTRTPDGQVVTAGPTDGAWSTAAVRVLAAAGLITTTEPATTTTPMQEAS
jgi:hypothetical protein